MPPRPSPLPSSTGRANVSDYQILTPRTPHSRSGRAEEAFSEVELDDFANNSNGLNEDEHDDRSLNPRAPLLGGGSSTGSGGAGYRSHGDDYGVDMSKKGKFLKGMTLTEVLDKIPLVIGSILAGILLVLIVLSMKKPETLQRMVGVSTSTAAVATASTPVNNANPPGPPPEIVSGDQQIELSPQPPSPSSHKISYENYTLFPLLPDQYLHECEKLKSGFMAHGDYWDLPFQNNGEIPDVEHHDMKSNWSLPEGGVSTVCKSSITYMLDGKVGLLADLAIMAQVAALARERNRTFLIDDTYWNRGKWTDHFQPVKGLQPGPEPGCVAPPPDELVACPRLARHWVVNSRTAKYHLGHGFKEHYEDPYAHFLNRLKPVFNAGVTSFTETIRPNAQNAAFIRAARQEFKQSIEQHLHLLSGNPVRHSHKGGDDDHGNDDAEDMLPTYVAVHVRRGDRKPSSYSFLSEKIPIKLYSDGITKVWNRIVGETYPTLNKDDKQKLRSSPFVYFASDSPEALDEFKEPFLATSSGTSTPHNHKKPLIFSLWESKNPELSALASKGEYRQKEFNYLDEAVRVKATRGMIVDFALISGLWSWHGDVTPKAVVCGISSNVCKTSAMGLGWELAFGGVNQMGEWNDTGRGWIDIDQNGRITPAWEAFELF